jgi:ComF family protein
MERMFDASPADVNRSGQFWLTRVMARGRRLPSAALWTLAPARCLMCDGSGDVGAVDICAHCLAQLPVSSPDWQDGFGAISRVCCPWRYDYPVDAMVRALKFSGERAYARLLGSLLARQLQRIDTRAETVVPMPLHRRRLQDRGFNQAAEIAWFAAAALALPLLRRALIRDRATLAQSTLSQLARRGNPRGAFVAGEQVRGRRIALVDDVITTGSTAAAAAEALLDAGAAEVEVWVLARVTRSNILHSG